MGPGPFRMAISAEDGKSQLCVPETSTPRDESERSVWLEDASSSSIWKWWQGRMSRIFPSLAEGRQWDRADVLCTCDERVDTCGLLLTAH